MIGESGEAYVQNYESEVVGIGIHLRAENEAFVIDSVIKDSPAEKAGLKAEDMLASIEGKTTKGVKMDKIVELLRGEKGSKVTVAVQRAGRAEPITVTMTRAAIPVLSVLFEMKPVGFGFFVFFW